MKYLLIFITLFCIFLSFVVAESWNLPILQQLQKDNVELIDMTIELQRQNLELKSAFLELESVKKEVDYIKKMYMPYKPALKQWSEGVSDDFSL